jgi:hypothetical protein
VSWYYLNSGLEWRKKAQDIMNGTKPFPAGEFVSIDNRKFTTDSLEQHVSLVSYLPCAGDVIGQMVVLDEIYNQFKETNKAIYLLLDSCSVTPTSYPHLTRKNWFVLPCPDSLAACQSLKLDWPDGMTFALVDRKGVIRSYYGINTMDEKRTLVEHMSLLLPRERQEKVELKRGDKK